MDLRQQALQDWLVKELSLSSCQLQIMPGDASFRRYFRLQVNDTSWVAMDAPPARENCLPFVAIANALRRHGVLTPEIIASDLAQGFLLLSDLGERQYLQELTFANAEKLYETALDSLARLQSCRDVSSWQVPLFTAQFMRQELELFKEWFLQRYLNLTLTSSTEKKLAQCFDFLADTSAQQPYVFMHRDFHSANLMVLPDNQVGVLDFQDAFMGPVTYDLVSLLRDCYVAWPEEWVQKLALSYREKIDLTSLSAESFLRYFDVMGMQRHLKALLTFSRKFCRDDNPHYLQHIPRTVNYILQVASRYSECEFLHDFMQEAVFICAG